MHDEDNAIGLAVESPSGAKWIMYGDKRFHDQVNKDNKTYCQRAVQASADEIYECWKSKKVPSISSFQAWTYAPTLASARGNQLLAPLFRFDKTRRDDIKKRKVWKFTSLYTYVTSAIQCQTSGLWKYPITIGQ